MNSNDEMVQTNGVELDELLAAVSRLLIRYDDPEIGHSVTHEPSLKFTILGPLEVARGARRLDLGGPKQRAVLAALILEANHVVALDRLLDQLWGDEPPPRATATLHAYVSNLRRVLEPDRKPRTPANVFVTQPPGYVLRVDPQQVDSLRFEALAAEGSRLLTEGRTRAARDTFAACLALWKGPPLADLVNEHFAQGAATRLGELRLATLEDRIEVDLILGRHRATIPELHALVNEHPYRERLWHHLMLGLYRSGRQAEALQAFQRARATLSEELGIDPSPRLQELEQDILRQSSSLDWKASPRGARPAAQEDDRRLGFRSGGPVSGRVAPRASEVAAAGS